MSTPRISVDVDGEDVVVYFSWSCARYERAVHVSRADGRASLSLSRDAARELHRQLGEKLGGQPPIPPERAQEVKDAVAQQLQDFADAGHPDEEELMGEAEARGAGA